MEEIFIDRLQAFFDYEGVNDNQVTVAAGLSVGLLNRTRKARSGMTSGNIEKILKAYPQLSADWLLTGQGEMLKSETKEILEEEATHTEACKKLKERISIVIDKYGSGKNTRFADLIGVREASIRGYLKGHLPKADFFEKVASNCEGISMDWLITGDGNMIKSDSAISHQSEQISSSELAVMISRSLDFIAENQREIQKTQEQIDILLRAINTKNQ